MFHADEIPMAHANWQVVTEQIMLLHGHYGHKELHMHLGITIDFAVTKKVCAIAQYYFMNKLFT